MLPPTMTAITISAPGGPEVLRPEKRTIPRAGPGQVLIKVAFAGVNRHDCHQRKRGHGPAGATDIPGLEVAGEVVEVGANVLSWRIGDQVCALVNGGGYAQYCVAEEVTTMPIPAGFDLQQAAALPEAMFTAWFNVFMLGKLAAGDWLLVHGGGSGVGTIAIQLGLLVKANVLTTARSAEKCAACSKLGAKAINYNQQDFVSAVKEATGGRGVDVILDMVGANYGVRNIEALALDGRLVHINSGGGDFCVPLSSIMAKRAVVTGSLLRGSSLQCKEEIARQLSVRAWPHLGTTVMPVIDSVIALNQTSQAHARMESDAHVGKILLAVVN